MSIVIAKLTDENWAKILNDWHNSEVATCVQKRLVELHADCCILEDYYLDKDFSAAYSSYYSRIYRQYARHCQRMHFFSEDLTQFLEQGRSLEVTAALEGIKARGSYLGYVVVRPIPHAPIGQVLIKASNTARESHLLVKAQYEVHLLGTVLEVCAAPLTEQDSRVGACAQASLWSAARHFHTKHRGPWVSTAEITEKATEIADANSSYQLPVGATYLTVDNLIRALRAIDRKPVVYAAKNIGQDLGPEDEYTWGELGTPESIINRYLDSGIPVVIGLRGAEEGGIGHAVLAVGHTIQQLSEEYLPEVRSSRAVFCSHILVNDDQRGPYLRMPIRVGGIEAETKYSVRNHIQYFIIPLPDKVFMTAEVAEMAAWSYFETQYPTLLNNSLPQLNEDEEFGLEKGRRILQMNGQNKVISRTYLTFGWKYHARLLRSDISQAAKEILLDAEFPRYVWVTEFGTFENLNHAEPDQRRIFGHIVIDATASLMQDHLLVVHLPGILVTYRHAPLNRTGPYLQSINLIAPEADYQPKRRGRL